MRACDISRRILEISLCVIMASVSVDGQSVAEHQSAIGSAATRPADVILRTSLLSTTLPSRYAYHIKTTETSLHLNSPGPFSGSIYVVNVVRDGDRVSLSMFQSLVKGSTSQPSMELRQIWDGGHFISRQTNFGGGVPSVIATASTRPIDASNIERGYSSPLFLTGHSYMDNESITALLLKSGSAQIVGHEDVNGRLCTIIETGGINGLYRVWLDPTAGYIMRRARVDTNYAVMNGGIPVGVKGKGTLLLRREVTIDNIEATNVGSTWIGSSGTMIVRATFSSGGYDEIKVSSIMSDFHTEFNPETSGAFQMKGILNGTPVGLRDRAPNDHRAYIWKDGRVILDVDGATSKKIDDIISGEKAAPKEKK